jgi:beta-glucosidase
MNYKFLLNVSLLGAIGLATVACQGLDNTTDTDSQILQKDAITLAWHHAGSSHLRIDDERDSVDLSGTLAAGGGLALEIQVGDLASGDLEFMMHCGADCVRMVDVSSRLRELEGQGWQAVSIPLSCFARPGDQLEHITEPFVAKGSGTGSVGFANIRFENDTENTFDCVPPEEVSVTPAPLTKHWALSWWMPRHEKKLARVAEGDVDLLLVGDSITHGWEDAGKHVWRQHFADYKTHNIGFSGDRTENVLWRLEQGEVAGISPEVAVLMIGTNNAGHREEPSEFTAKGVAAVIDELKTRLPDTHILLLGIFPRGESADDPLRQLNRETNTYLEKMGQDERVTYLNINEAFLDPGGKLSEEIMPDLLHPNETGYEIWAQAMKPTLSELLKN